MKASVWLRGLFACGVVALAACSEPEQGAVTGRVAGQGGGGPAREAVPGVDFDGKIIRIGALNGESGPAGAIGKPYAVGKRLLAAEINAGDSGLLPEGWRVELIERDHGYNPQRSVQMFNEIRDDVLFIATSFGTPNTLPLRPMLERSQVVAFPASLSSKMAEFAWTPPIGASYTVEAQRAMDWVVESAGGAPAVKAAVIYQQDDYGQDGHGGWMQAAAHHGVTVVSEQTYAPGQADYTAALTALKNAGATHVMLATLPSATGPILGAAAQLDYAPVWVGNAPAWIDRFFDPNVIPASIFANFYLMNSLPYWGEPGAFMDRFLALYERFGREQSPPDSFILGSYVQGRVAIEALRRMLESGDISRADYLASLQSLDDYDVDGAMPFALDLSSVPYVVGDQARVLKPDMAAGTWQVVADFARPASLN